MRLSLTLLLLQLWSNVQVSLSQNACQNLPLVPKAHISNEDKKIVYLAGDVIHFTCETGYISGLTITYACVNTGWKVVRQGKCYLKPCPLPEDTPNGFYQLTDGDDLVFGTTIQYFCNDRYYMVSKEDKRTCMLDGWTNHVPICEPSSCELPPVDEGMTVVGIPMNDEAILPDRYLTFRCTIPGQRLNGEASLLCGKDGKWNRPFPTCEDITCTVGDMHPNLTTVELVPADKKVKVGEKITFACDEGFTLDKAGEVECLQTGQWSDHFPTCNDKCIIQGVSENVGIIKTNPRNQLRPGQKVQFRCLTRGHTVQGQSEIHCLANGQWSHPFPTCGAPLKCERPPMVESADTRHTPKPIYAHGESVQYICPNFYLLESGAFKTCRNGEWIGEVRCLRPCTVNKDDMNRQNIKFKYTKDDKLYSTHNDFIEFLCKRGRHVGGIPLRVQCNNGYIPLPTCH